jgi:hypothetical protein
MFLLGGGWSEIVLYPGPLNLTNGISRRPPDSVALWLSLLVGSMPAAMNFLVEPHYFIPPLVFAPFSPAGPPDVPWARGVVRFGRPAARAIDRRRALAGVM